MRSSRKAQKGITKRLGIAALATVISSGVVVVALATALAAPALAAPSPPFTQCPAIGADTSCGVLIVINSNGSATVLNDPSQGPFDGVEDTLIGVQNNFTATITNLPLTGTSSPPIFGFEGDGLCAGYPGSPAGCPFGSTGYEGPNTSFSNISTDQNSGTVNFTAGIAPGKSAYFSLEGTPGTSSLCIRTLALSPSSATNPVGGSHTVTATLTQSSGCTGPVSGWAVSFSISSGPNAGKTGSGTTNASGQAAFTYTDTGGAGTDKISASATLSTNTVTAAPASKTWGSGGGGVTGNLFQVELRNCLNLHVGYNRFPNGTVVRWNVSQNKVVVSHGQFTAIGGGTYGSKTYHFLTQPLGVTLQPTPDGHVHFHWTISNVDHSYTAIRDPGCG